MSLSRLVDDDVYEICRNFDELKNWLQQKELFGDFQGELCSKCNSGFLHLVKDISYKEDKVVYRCTNRKCNSKKTIRSGSWFAGSHLSLKFY